MCTYQPNRQHFGCWLQTCHISNACWLAPEVCEECGQFLQLWWGMDAYNLKHNILFDHQFLPAPSPEGNTLVHISINSAINHKRVKTSCVQTTWRAQEMSRFAWLIIWAFPTWQTQPFTFEEMAHQCKIEVGAKGEAHKVIHLLTVPLQRMPNLHEHFLRTLISQKKGKRNILKSKSQKVLA